MIAVHLNLRPIGKRHMDAPRFRSFDEFAAHIKSKYWEDAVRVFGQDYQALDYVGRLPPKKRLAHPLFPYLCEMGDFHHFLHQHVPMTMRGEERAHARKRMQSIIEELVSRG